MRPDTDQQKMEQAKVLLKEAGVIWVFWTPEDLADIAENLLTKMGLRFDISEILDGVKLTHLSIDEDAYECICEAIEASIHTLALNKLGG